MQIPENPHIASLVDTTLQPPSSTKQGTGSPDTRLEPHNPTNFTQTNNDQWGDNRDPRNFWDWLTAPIIRIFGGGSSQESLPDFQNGEWTRQTDHPPYVTYSKMSDQPYGGEGKIETKYDLINGEPKILTRTELDKNGNPTKSLADYYNEYPNVAKEETITYRDGKPSLRTDNIFSVTGNWVRGESYAMGADGEWHLQHPDGSTQNS
ncbi:hypothetical protein [Dyella nitratireducens]|uniref:Uncharacterized protein n=1 Tax=Dyella nitratireducens TaxID=1849580 RepID=A0ABQ1GSA5_9GAMM|nr:hypothetical protein [Dyella nitratireducens]GGA49084.1 hypothetical protein GCM10010981_42970 [Dyella nitratireducens]GLQ42226.1 hypothetical protein GCM10007902_20760 [Dyella nitratireducens]